LFQVGRGSRKAETTNPVGAKGVRPGIKGGGDSKKHEEDAKGNTAVFGKGG